MDMKVLKILYAEYIRCRKKNVRKGDFEVVIMKKGKRAVEKPPKSRK